MDMMCNYLPGDPRLVEQIVKELKSQGIFDQFRKECISDVDTKPAYQNLRQRVEGSVSSFLQEQTWTPDMNKNQVREMLRKHINESGFLETGVERIVDQVVNPKINSVFIPKVDEVMYKFLGIERPKANLSTPLEINTVHDLLPKDLEAISPELPEEKEQQIDENNESKIEETTPNADVSIDKIMPEENSVDSQSSIISGLVSQDSSNSMKQDSLMSLNSSERMSPPETISKMELEDACDSQKSSDSNSKPETSNEEKNIENETEPKELIENPPETSSEKSSDESKSKSKDKKTDKHHSSSDRSKSRSDKEKERSKSDRSKKDEKDGKAEDKKYKIPKLSDKKDSKSKDKDDKHKSDKGRSERDKERSDKDKKYDKDKKSKHSSEKSSSSSDKSKRDSSEKREKDDKKDKKESSSSSSSRSRSDKGKDDKRSSSSKKRDSHSSKDKDKESSSRSSKEDDKNKSEHSSSSKKDSKSHKEEDKSKKKEDKDKEDRKRKRRSKDDHHSSKEKRNGGRSSDRDSDGPSSSKRPHVSPPNGEYSSQQTSQDSATLNSESSSGYSGSSDKAEDKQEVASNSLLTEMQKIKVPKFASNMAEAKKIMKIKKLLKKIESMIKDDPENPENWVVMKNLQELTGEFKREKTKEENVEAEVETQKTEAAININDFISSSNISMDKWNALEEKLMEQVINVDYNSYESPYMDEEDRSFEEPTRKDEVVEKSKDSAVICIENNDSVIEINSTPETSKLDDSQKGSVVELKENEEKNLNSLETMDTNCNEIKEDSIEEQKVMNQPEITEVSEQQTILKDANSANEEKLKLENVNRDIMKSDMNITKYKDFKQRAIVLIQKHSLIEKMVVNNENEVRTEKMVNNINEIEKENVQVNLGKDILENSQVKTQGGKKILSKEQEINNLDQVDSIPHDRDIYSLKNSCEVCLEADEDSFVGFDRSDDLGSLNFLKRLIDMLETEIRRFKEQKLDCINANIRNDDHTRKRKVNDRKSDVSNNNSESKRLEIENIEIISKNSPPVSKKINQRTNTSTRSKSDHQTTNHNELKGVDGTDDQKIHSSSKSVDRSTEKRNRTNQRYSSEDLYKPRIFLRRGRDSKNP